MSGAKLIIPKEFSREGYQGYALPEGSSSSARPTVSTTAAAVKPATPNTSANPPVTNPDPQATAYRFQSLIRGTG